MAKHLGIEVVSFLVPVMPDTGHGDPNALQRGARA
jgi:hypothetical protein